MVATTLDALTGELLLGSLTAAPGLAVLAGVRDQTPIAALVALAATQLDKIPSELPDGTTVAVTLDSVELAGKPGQALHGLATLPGTSAATYAAMKLNPEAWAYGAGPYAGLLLGADEKGLQAMAGLTPKGPSADLLATLPPALGDALAQEHVVFALHAPLDGLGLLFGTEVSSAALDQLPPQLSSAIDLRKIVLGLGTTLAPLSAVSQWLEVHDGRWVGHFALSVFGDARSQDGRAALAAIDELVAGQDSATVYRALADAHAKSPRGHAYLVRAGQRADGTLASTALMGVLAAIAVPALTKYMERSKAAAGAR